MPQRYFFYFSCAHADWNPYLQKFYEDLSAEIRQLKSLKPETQVGFFDQTSLAAGQMWGREAEEALLTSNVLVCILSRSFFNSEFAGKEFQIFRERQKLSQERGDRSSLIFPVLWEPPESIHPLPEGVADIQYSTSEFGESYANEGLKYLIRRGSLKDDYHNFISRFAEKVIRAADSHPLTQPQLASLAKVRSAFHETGLPPIESLLPRKGAGPGFVRFIIATGRRQEMLGVRQNLDGYGEEGIDWMPFLPQDTEPIGLTAQRCAVEENLFSECLPFDEKNLIQELRQAEQRNTVVIIIVDVWALCVEKYAQALSRYDEQNFINSAVLILWNSLDNETAQNQAMLQDIVRMTFIRKSLADAGYFRDQITSLQALRNEISVTLSKIRSRILERSEVIRNASLMPAISKPKIN